MPDPNDRAAMRRARYRASQPPKKPLITWHLPALLGGLALLIFGIIRPMVCWQAWQIRATADPIVERLNADLRKIGVEPVADERPKGFCR